MHQRILLPLLVGLALTLPAQFAHAQGKNQKPKRPNIVWITCEDMGPHLGCYGDTYATSPNIDKFAKKALRFLNVWSHAPVCAPSRTGIITGMYATSTGSEHMRSQTVLPPGFHMFPGLLRQLGYYCTNNVKEDYNLVKTKGVWDESSNKAHWKNRAKDQPFFAVFNFTITHESQIRKKPHKLVHDPAKVKVPAYHPDTPEVRHDWTQYYDNITTMDTQFAKIIQELEDAGLLEETIVIFFSDHGSGMPRNKRFPSNAGLHVPMLVYVPAAFKELAPGGYAPGGTSARPVGFVDLAPTMLSIAGEPAAEYHQGRAFMGKHAVKAPQFLFGFRGRMDERYDLIRSVKEKNFVYLRNFHPHKIHGQHVSYMFETPTTKVWKKMFDLGKLNEAQSAFWKPKAVEELYDLSTDPDEVKNLAGLPEHKGTLKKFRVALRNHVMAVRDVGFLPENEIHERAKGSSPYQVGHDNTKYPLAQIFATVELAASLQPDSLPALQLHLGDQHSAVRYWAVMGLFMRGKEVVQANRNVLHKAMSDDAAAVRIAAAEALGTHGDANDLKAALPVLLALGDPGKNDVHVCLQALNALDALGDRAASAWPTIKAWPKEVKNASDPRSTAGVPRLLASIAARFDKQDKGK